MPLPIKQYKHMFKDVKFLATTAQPSYKEVSHWIDLLEDPTGGTIKVWNGTGWKKISGEGDSDTGLVIGDTTGTAYDGGKGKDLEDTVADMEKRLGKAFLFKFDTLDLKNKTNSFLFSFLEVLIGSIGAYNDPVILQYSHVYDLNTDTYLTTKAISSVVTVAMRSGSDLSHTYEFILYSNIYYSKANDRDQFIKIIASFNLTDEQNIQAEFQVEEVPVDLNSTISLDSFYVFPEDKLVNGAVLTEDEYSNLQKAVNGQKTAWYGTNFMELSKDDDSDTIYFGINTSYINREYRQPDDYYSHKFLYLTGSIDSERTVHISHEYNKEGSLCYVYGQDNDILFTPIQVIVQDPEKLVEAANMASTLMFLDKFNSENDDSVSYSSFLSIASLHSGDIYSLISSNIVSASEDAINIEAQSRYLIGGDGTLGIAKTVLKQIELKLSGDGTKFLSDNGTYKEIDLSSKQDTLVSGTNIKTINGQSVLGSGDITLETTGGGITDAPADGKTYGRRDSAWTEITTPDTSTFATKDDLATKLDTSTYNSEKAEFATKTELSNKLDTSTYNSDKAGFATNDNLATKQDTLVSGTNIKTINNQSLLGEGNIEIAAENSSAYVFNLDEYTSPNQRTTGTIADEDLNALMDAAYNQRFIFGEKQGDFLSYIPLEVSTIGNKIYLKGEFIFGPICLEIDFTTKAYQGYLYSERVESNDSSTVTVTPLPDELIYIQSGTSTLTRIIVSNPYNFRLLVSTGGQNVALEIKRLIGITGATIDGTDITLEANSKYEIDVYNNIAVVAKINPVNRLE